jgi:hypothetical protein
MPQGAPKREARASHQVVILVSLIALYFDKTLFHPDPPREMEVYHDSASHDLEGRQHRMEVISKQVQFNLGLWQPPPPELSTQHAFAFANNNNSTIYRLTEATLKLCLKDLSSRRDFTHALIC